MARTVLIFAYRRSRMDAGSTVMRAHQLARLVTPHLPDVDIRLSACSRREVLQNLWARMLPKGAVVFVVKLLFPSTADILRRRNCVLCLDVVDLEFKLLPGPELQAACYISPSMAGVEILRERLANKFGQGQALPLILPILHNADERIYGVRIKPQDRARIAYFGNPAYAEIPASVAGQMVQRAPASAGTSAVSPGTMCTMLSGRIKSKTGSSPSPKGQMLQSWGRW
jgi:hypothetical protein